MGKAAPHGISMPLFLAVGYGLWRIFSTSVNRCMTAVSGNKALLTFPQVTEFDLMLARVIVITVTQFLSGLVIVVFSIVFGYPFVPASATQFFIILIAVPLMGLGVGMVLSSLTVYIPALEKIVPMILRIMFFISGVFFGVSAFSHKIAELLLLNPVFQAIELMRESLHVAYRIDGLSVTYVVVLCYCYYIIGQ